jgi:hypothetical protein
MAMSALATGALRPQEPAGIVVSGHVLKFGTREPAGDVPVELIPESGGAAAPTTPPRGAAAGLQGQDVPTGPTGPERFRTVTAADGSFTLRGAPPGEYRLYANPAGSFLPAEFGQRTPTGVGLPITLSAGQNLTNVALTITPTAAISGRVTDAHGEPVGYANAIAGRVVYRDGVRTLEAVQSSMTNDRGEYRIFWLAPGTYILTAIPLEMRTYTMPATPPARFGGREHISLPLVALRPSPDGGRPIEVTYMPSYYPGVADIRASQRITVRPGETVRADFSVAASEVPSLHVRGTVRTTETGAAQNIRVTLVPRFVDGHSVQPPAASANAEGAFDIMGVAPGAYLLFAGPTVMPLEVGDRDVNNVRIAIPPPVTIPWSAVVEGYPNAQPNVQISLRREPMLAGAPGTPVGAPAGVANPGNRGGRGAAPPASINTGHGDFRVVVGGLPASTYVKSIRLGGDDVLRNGLQVYGPVTNPLQIVLAPNAGSLEGVAMDGATRQPFANAVIALLPPAELRQSRWDLFKTTASKIDGRFRIDGIPPGEYKLFAWGDVQTGEWYNAEFMRDAEVNGVAVRVAEGPQPALTITVIGARGDAQ